MMAKTIKDEYVNPYFIFIIFQYSQSTTTQRRHSTRGGIKFEILVSDSGAQSRSGVGIGWLCLLSVHRVALLALSLRLSIPPFPPSHSYRALHH